PADGEAARLHEVVRRRGGGGARGEPPAHRRGRRLHRHHVRLANERLGVVLARRVGARPGPGAVQLGPLRGDAGQGGAGCDRATPAQPRARGAACDFSLALPQLSGSLPPQTRHNRPWGNKSMLRLIFSPGLRLIGLVGPLARAVMIVGLFAVPLAVAGRLGAHGRELLPVIWALFLLPAYLVCSLVLWTQLGMRRISRVVERIALGDLSVSATAGNVKGRDAEGLWDGIGRMSENLTRIVEQVNTSCDVIVKAAREIDDGYANLSQRAEERT